VKNAVFADRLRCVVLLINGIVISQKMASFTTGVVGVALSVGPN
jgi:hypothetical protein